MRNEMETVTTSQIAVHKQGAHADGSTMRLGAFRSGMAHAHADVWRMELQFQSICTTVCPSIQINGPVCVKNESNQGDCRARLPRPCG